MRVLFRADSSSTIGTGHIMRDLVLAKEFKDSEIFFASKELQGNINHKITDAGYKLETLKSDDIEELDGLIKNLHVDFLVIDHYGIDADYEKKLKSLIPALKIMVLDDTYEKHCCDILLNHNIYADEKKYKKLVPKTCELRCGEKYTLIRDEFIKERKKKTSANVDFTKTVFISMGGADTQNLTPKILKVLQKFQNIKAIVVTTEANKNLPELKKQIKNKKWVNLHVNTNRVAKLVRKSDFAIITPSVSANELYFMQKPFLAIQTAQNQEEMYRFLKKNGYCVMKNFSAKKIEDEIAKLLDIELIDFTDLTLKEKKMVLEWRNNENIKKWMLNQDDITLHNHLRYIESLKSSKEKKYMLVKKVAEYIGVIDFTNIDLKERSAHFGLYANPLKKIDGAGSILQKASIKYAFDILKLAKLKLEVFSENEKAIGLYKKFNFKKVSQETVENREIIHMELKNEDRQL